MAQIGARLFRIHTVLDDPDKLSRFVSFVNAPGAPDPTVEFTEKNGRKIPVLIGTPSFPSR